MKGSVVSREAIERELRRRGITPEIIDDEERERRNAELTECAADPVYFISKYVRTYDPRNIANPYSPFVLYPRQEDLVDWLYERFMTGTAGVVEKSKDVGVSWILSSFLFWAWLFVEGFSGGVGSRKLEYVDQRGDPKTIFEKFRIALAGLPQWMRPLGFDAKKHDLEGRLLNPDMRSSIIGEGGEHIGRGGRTSIYFVDEYNYLPNPSAADAALADNTNVQIYVGTPNGPVGLYEKREIWPCFTYLWVDDPRKGEWKEYAKSGELVAEGNGQHPTAPVPLYDKRPTRSEDGHLVSYPWYEARCEKFRDSPWLVKQETDINYLGTGSPRFDREFLLSLKERLRDNDPIIFEYPGMDEDDTSGSWSGDVKIWKEPDPKAFYLITADVAEGESANTEGDPDWSVAHVYDCETWEQVATYKSRCETYSFALDLAVIGQTYNWAELCIERTGPGLAVIKALVETDMAYPNVYGVLQANEQVRHGMITTSTSKKRGNAELASYIIDMKDGFDGFIWNDKETVDELFYFIIEPNGRENGAPGHHDDHGTCCRMAAERLPILTNRRRVIERKMDKPRISYMVGWRAR